MDEPIPIEGIVEGDPAALAAVCAVGGSAVLAYCSAAGARTNVAETVVAALADFRRGVVANADQEPSEVQNLLLSVTDGAARRFAGVAPSLPQQATAQTALENAETHPLAPGLAPRIITALVKAAPVTALGGDAAAVREAAEQHYRRMFEATPAASAAAPMRTAPGAGAPPDSGPAAWVPPELLGNDGAAAAAPDAMSDARWRAPSADLAPAPVAQPESAQVEAEAEAPAAAPAKPKPPPGTLIIKRGGHWPFRRRPRRPKHSGGAGNGLGRTRNVAIAGVVGLAVGAGAAALATPDKTVEPDPILVRPLDTPFTVDGAVFNVARTGTSLWALQIRRHPSRPGHAWLTLAAQTRNISRPNFRPRGLGYRLRTASGIVIGPDTALVAGEIPAVGGRLPTGKRTSVHLGFQVPTGQRGLTLEFDPNPRGPRVRVPLN